MSEDPYRYPDTDVLRNKLGIQDVAELRGVEAKVTRLRMAALRHAPVPGVFDLAHLRHIHKWLFSDIYDWAGQLRTVAIRKDGYLFANPQFIEEQAGELFTRLANENQLQGLALDDFVDRAAWYLGEVNAIHPFREGNGRAQREFLRQLAAESGWEIDWAEVDPDENIRASVHAMNKDHSMLAQLIRRHVRLLEP